MFGYGALISDVRVSWSNGKHADILQKVYAVAPNMLAGFAGSVLFGFAVVEDMRKALQLQHPMDRWFPRAAAWWWWRRARRLFASASPSVQGLGSALLLVGPGPEPTTPWPRAYCVRMRSPEFRPEFLMPVAWHSIGSGAEHESARHYAEEYRKTFIMSHGQMEMGNRGGAAFSTAVSVGMGLRRDPMPSVSEALILGTAFLNECKIAKLSSTDYDPDGHPVKTQAGLLADSWESFLGFTGGRNLDASSALA